MMMRESRDVAIKPFLFKVGLALTLSIAGFLISRIRFRRTNPSSDSRIHSDHPSGYDSDVSSYKAQHNHDIPAKKRVSRSSSGINFSDAEFPDTEELFLKETISDTTSRSKLGSPPEASITPEKHDYDQEMKNLKNIVRLLQEKETNLEVKLLDYYDLREKEKEAMELQNRLVLSNMEAKMSDLKAENLISENRRLEAQVEDHTKLVAELERSREKVKLLKKRIGHESEENRELTWNLQQRILKLQEEHKDAVSDEDLQMKLQKLKDLQDETEELRKSNLRLEIENSELAQRLESTQILANALLEDPGKDALKEQSEHLKQENESLTKEIEKLKADRCTDVEELVYLRWINACLRHELKVYQPSPGKTVARDLSKSLSPRSEKKAKQLILEYAKSEEASSLMDLDSPSSDQWSSSRASSFTDTDEYRSPFGNSSSSSSSSSSSVVSKTTQSNPSKKKFFQKLRKLIKGKSNTRSVQFPTLEKSVSPEFCSSGSIGGNDETCQPRRRSDCDSTPNRMIYRSFSDVNKLMMLKEEEEDNTVNITPLTKCAEALKQDSGEGSKPKRGLFGRKTASYSSFL